MNTKRLVTDAMLAAIYFVFSLFAIEVWGLKLTFEGLPVVISAALFGPVDGLVVGLLGSFMNQMLKHGFTMTTLLWILPAGVRGLIVGWYAWKHGYRMNVRQTVMIVVLAALAVTTLNTAVWYVDSILYKYPYQLFIWSTALRYLTGILTAIVFAAVLPPLLKVLREEVLSR